VARSFTAQVLVPLPRLDGREAVVLMTELQDDVALARKTGR
jgi:hypothetical protein